MKVLNKMYDRVEDELESFCKKPEWTSSDIQVIGWLIDQVKDIETTKAMKEAGYSQANSRMSYEYEDPYMSFARGNSNRSYEGGNSNRSYEGGYSERRGRDSMGRYTSRDGYSNHDRPMIDMLREKMYSTNNETERENYRKVIDQLEK